MKVPKLPPPKTDGPLHVPVDCGAPPSDANKFTAAPLEHKMILPLFPALGAGLTVTVTVAVAFTQGAMPTTVYV